MIVIKEMSLGMKPRDRILFVRNRFLGHLNGPIQCGSRCQESCFVAEGCGRYAAYFGEFCVGETAPRRGKCIARTSTLLEFRYSLYTVSASYVLIYYIENIFCMGVTALKNCVVVFDVIFEYQEFFSGFSHRLSNSEASFSLGHSVDQDLFEKRSSEVERLDKCIVKALLAIPSGIE